jgi:hypothetical protein
MPTDRVRKRVLVAGATGRLGVLVEVRWPAATGDLGVRHDDLRIEGRELEVQSCSLGQ